MPVNRAVGQYGERVAAGYLEAAGYEVLERNWRCLRGEIDIVALDGECLVICEVKTRRSGVCGDPLEAVTQVKLDRLRQLTAAWLAGQERYFPQVRIDVVAVRRPPRGPAEVEHVRGVG
jgi:putative endonuclease